MSRLKKEVLLITAQNPGWKFFTALAFVITYFSTFVQPKGKEFAMLHYFPSPVGPLQEGTI